MNTLSGLAVINSVVELLTEAYDGHLTRLQPGSSTMRLIQVFWVFWRMFLPLRLPSLWMAAVRLVLQSRRILSTCGGVWK